MSDTTQKWVRNVYAELPKDRGLTEDTCRLTAIRAGDRQDFERLCCECYPRLAHFLSLIIPDEPIEEVCVDVLRKGGEASTAALGIAQRSLG